ncbi:MAG: hypothetical protein DI586_00425 [Micavibrio aeruginosavorus]|uniref:Uncharacterized protein n=1 Tax=Micavibrio aeruginosavorus TaxID=349221 RepID=A0A2W5HUS7_9BACT|nr:MAG: hypothetical protein DI586_00425 [Micavibrio aeruginosavorus]
MEKFTSTAKIIDGTLVLTLPDAVRPVVWQMQLGQTKSSALEVREETNGNWMLMLKTPRADVMEIAPFPSKEKAVKALIAVSRALEKAQGQMAPYNGNPAYPVPAVISCSRFGWLTRFLKGVLTVFLALLLLIILGMGALWLLSPPVDTAAVSETAQTLPQAAPDQEPEQVIGKPVSADDFLNGQ